MHIVELQTEDDFRRVYPLLHELRTHLSEPEFLELVSKMRSEGYRLFCVVDGDSWVAAAGVAIRHNLYYGHYLWVFDLVTTATQRSKGYGAYLLGYLEDLARKEDCDTIALSSGVQRLAAHRFYETKCGYTRVSWTFKKSLKG